MGHFILFYLFFSGCLHLRYHNSPDLAVMPTEMDRHGNVNTSARLGLWVNISSFLRFSTDCCTLRPWLLFVLPGIFILFSCSSSTRFVNWEVYCYRESVVFMNSLCNCGICVWLMPSDGGNLFVL